VDLLTQGAVGAALALGAARRGEMRAAAAAGFAAGLLADADTFIRSSGDPLLTLEFHRHFSHALVMIPVGALIASLALWPLLRRQLRWPRLYLYCLAGYAPSGLLDACTSYGTHLLWPFSDERIAWGIVAIVDPLFTLILLAGLAVAALRRRPRIAHLGVLVAAGYLALGALQQQRAEAALASAALARGHRPEAMLVKPTLGNLLLWRGLYRADGRLYADAVRAGLRTSVHPGERAPLAPAPASGDGARFAALTGGWLVRHPRHPARLGDARYAMLPTGLRPMWGIETGPDGRLRLEVDRSMSAGERRAFLDLLLGRAGEG